MMHEVVKLYSCIELNSCIMYSDLGVFIFILYSFIEIFYIRIMNKKSQRFESKLNSF